MKITKVDLLLLLLLVWMFTAAIKAHSDESHIASCTVTREDSYDFNGMQFFMLSCGSEGGGLLSMSKDVPMAIWLTRHDKERVSIQLIESGRLSKE